MIGLAAALSACAAVPELPAQGASAARGQALAERHCAACHAIGRAGESGFAGAPPLRTLSHRYSIWSLEEALAEGIVVGHPAMPPFRFEPDEVSDLLAYLETIQEAPRQER